MKRRIALLLVVCMLTTMLPPALAEEIVQIPNSADATLELPGDADGIVEDGLPVLDLGDVDPLQLDLGDLEQTDIEPENIPGEEGESGEADARDGGADNATAAGVPKTLTLGQKQTYAIDASKVSGGKTVTYKSSKATVATVSKKGVITAKKNGTAKITLTVGKKTVATCTVTVVNAPGKVTLPASSITLDVKATYQIKPKLPNKTMASFTYSSADKKIAKVSKEGLVTGLKVGSTTITVKTHNNKTAELSVTVKATEPTEAGKVTLSQTKATLSMGDTLQLTATLPKGTASVLTWTSDKPAVAKVNDYGLVTAEGAGTAKITVATANGKKASCTVTVNNAPGKVTVKPTAVTLAPGESIQLKATLPKGTTSELTWKSAKSAVAKVNENGLVTAVKAGTAKITVETYNGKKDTCVVTVKKNGGDDDAKAPKKVTLDQTKATLSAGDTLQLVATLPAGTVSSLTWTSDNTKVAKVKSTGLVTAVGAGTAKITVTTANKKKATCTLTVKKAPESVTLNAHELILGVGETFLLRTTLLPKGATSDLTWKSSKASVVRVNEDGMITAVKAGTAKITVETYNGKKDTCKVTVEKAALVRAYTEKDSFSLLPTKKATLQVKTEIKQDPELTYKWYQGSTAISGASGAEYTVTAGNVGSYAYKCVVSDGTNSQEVAFKVTVDNGLTAKASSAAEQTICTKQETTLSVTAECSVGKPTYQWYEGDTVIDGATSASYDATKADAGSYAYKCVVSDGYGSTAEVGFTVTVKARTLTDATAQTASFSLKPGDKATLKVNVTTDGEPGLTYKWYLGENEITGANAASYAVTAGNVGSYAYKCVVTDDSAKKNSKTVSFTVTVANGLSAKASSATEQTVYTGKAATLSVTASATTNDKLSYQWYEGDTAISGATSASYDATKADAGSYAYKCVVSDGYGSTAEVGFTVTVKARTLTDATAQTASFSLKPGDKATLKVNVTTDGEPGLTYKWYLGENEITGANAASYAVTAGNVGSYAYKCVVTDDSAKKNSKTVSFTVTVANGLTAKAESATAQTVFTGKAATLTVTASATTNDKLSYQWYEGDTAISGATKASYAATKASAGSYAYKCVVSDGYGSTAEVGFTVTVKAPTLTGATADKAAFTIAPKGIATLKVNTTADGEPTLTYKWFAGATEISGATGASYAVTAGNVGKYTYKCQVSDGKNTKEVTFTVTVANGLTAKAASATAQTVFTGKAATLTVNASATTNDKLSYQWYEGDTAISGATKASYSATKASAGSYAYKCVVSDGYGSTAEVGFTVTVKAPTLTGATADKAAFTVAPKGTATLKVNTTADGEPTLTYKWFAGATEISGATGASYAVTAGNVGKYTYKCQVSDGKNTKEVTFTVTVANGLTAKAASATAQTVFTGKAATLSVTASATTNDKLSYQWYEGGNAISGETSTSYAATKSAAGDYTYKCVVSDGYGSTAEVGFTVTVKAPTLTGATADKAAFTVAPKGTATLKVNTTTDGEPTLTYKWFEGTTEITGATGASYAVTAGNAGKYTYRCQVSDGTNTKEATFTVTVANDFAAKAASATAQTVFTGKAATLTVTASATVDDTLSYQWYEGDAAISGETSTSYAATKSAAGDYTYKCVVNDGYGSTAEVGFTVTVKEPTLTGATADKAAFTVAPKGTATLKVNVTVDGEPALSYKWYLGETAIEGATGAEYTVTAGNVGSYAYKCVVSDDSTTQNSATVDFTVTVNNGFAAEATSATEQTVYTRKAATLSVTASATVDDTLSYQWYEGGTAISGETSTSYAATKADAGDYTYKCVVSDGYGDTAEVFFNVTVKEPSLTGATAETDSFALKSLEQAMLKVNVVTDGAPVLTYKWYLGETAIEGVTGAEYTVTAGNVGSYAYKCEVSDGTNTREADFTVTVDNGFGAKASSAIEQTVFAGETAMLSVTAVCSLTVGETAIDSTSFQWYEGDIAISGADSPSYAATKADAGIYAYKCVLNDGFGSSAEVGFTVTVKAPSLTEASAETASFKLKPTDEATLKVVTECEGEPALSYKWFEGTTEITGATAASYALTAGNVGEYTYKCQVSDGTNTKEVPFTVTVANDFSAQVKGEAAKTVFMGAAATLEVEATCATDDELSFKWTRTDAPETVLGTEAAYTTAAFDTVGEYGYTCEVNDGYGSAAATLSFTVNVVNVPELTSATAVRDAFTVAPTGSETLEVQTECVGEPTLTYAWYADEATDPIDGANEASYAVTAGNVGEYTYRCQVSDGTKTSEVTFTVTVDNGLTASASGEAELTVAVDEAAELAVEAECTTGEPTYRWFEGESSEPIEGAESASYSVTKAEAGTYTFRCEVGDAYGSAVQSVEFTVTVTDGSAVEGVAINAENFPDPVFRSKVAHYDEDGDGDGVLSKAEAESVDYIECDGSSLRDLKGIEYFTALKTLYCYECYDLTSVDLSHNTELSELLIECNGLTSLDVSANTELTRLYCSNNPGLTSVDLSHNTKLEKLSIHSCALTSLNVSANTELTYLSCYSNKLSELDLTNCSALVKVVQSGDINSQYDYHADCEYTIYTSDSTVLSVDKGIELKGVPEPNYIALDETNFPDAAFRSCVKQAFDTDEDNRLSEREIRSAANLTYEGGDLTSLKGIEILTELVELNASTSKGLTTVDLSHNGKLRRLYLNGCGLTALDISGNTQLETLFVQANSLTELDLSGCGKLIESAMTEPEEETEDGHAYLNYRGRLMVDATVALKGLPTVSEDWPTIRLNEATTVNIANPGDKVFFSFVPAETGTFHFYDFDYYPIGYLYDANLKQLMSTEATDDEEYWEDEGFSLKCDLTEGEQYYFATRHSGNETGSYEVCLTQIKGLQRAWAEESDISVAPNEPATLVVNVENIGDGALTCVWYDADEKVIEGAEGLTYTIESVTRAGNYRCEVRDAFGRSMMVSFTVSIDSGLTARAAGDESLMVVSGETVELKVEASIKLGSIHYQWEIERYDEEEDEGIWEPVDGATGATFTTPAITRYCTYQCRVSDDYGNTRTVRFYISVGKSMDGDAFTMTMRNASNDEPVTDNKLMVGNDLRIDIDTTGKPEDIGDDLSGWARLYTTGANEVEIASDEWYDYWNDDDCNFTLNLSELEPGSYKLRLKLEAYDYLPWVKDIDFTIDSLGVLEAPAFTLEDVGEEKRILMGKGFGIRIVDPDEDCSYYGQLLIDGQISQDSLMNDDGTMWFNAPGFDETRDFELRAVCKKEGYTSGVSEAITLTSVCLGNLPAPVFNLETAGNGYALTYTNWPEVENLSAYVTLYTADERSWVNSFMANSSTHIAEIDLDGIESGGYLLCVTYQADGYKLGEAEDYPITVENHGEMDAPAFTLNQEAGSVVLGSKLVVTIQNRPEDIENLSYTAKIQPTYNEYDVYAEAEYDAEADTLTFEKLSGLWEDEFNLVVTASALGYTSGKSSQAITVVRIENHLSADRVNESDRIYVAPNGTATLEVNASCDNGDIHYQWYKDDEPIEGATNKTYTTEEITGYTAYYCNVSDDFGSNCLVWFYVSVENHLTAQAVGDSSVTVAPKGRATLVVSASSDDNSHTYRWSKEVFAEYEGGGSGWQRIYFDDANGATLTTDEITENIYYYCEVRDSYGSSEEVCFYVHVDNELSVQARDGKTTIRAFSGDDVTLAVEVTAIDTEGLMLKWQKYSEYEGYTEIEGKEGYELTLVSVSESARYQCAARDAYGNEASVEFNVEVIDVSSVEVLTLDTPVSVTLEEDETALFSYECVKTGVYQFGSSENANLTIRGELYEEDWSTVASDIDSGRDYNFRLLYRLEAGRKYYFGARYEYSESGSFQVCLEEALFMENLPALTLDEALTFDTDETDKTIAFTFAPSESGLYDIHFGLSEFYATSVYDAAMHKLNDAEGFIVTRWEGDGKYHVRLNMEAGETYTVIAEYRNVYGADSFTVEAERLQGLYEANSVESSFTAAPGEQVTLEVYTKCTDDVPLTFEWYREGEETPISGANGPTYSLTATRAESYKCEVSDTYGHTHEVWFWIYIENGLQARRVTPAVEDEEDTTIHANMGDTVALAVEANCNEGTPSYQWYEDGYEIEGANSAAYTTKPIRRERTEVYCHVSDDYGNTRDVWFYIDCDNYVDNNLQAWAVSDYISVTPEETATLEASVSANDLADATAQWFYRPRTLNDQGEWDEGEWVDLGAPEAITAEDGQATVTRTLGDGELHTTGYRCEIVDKYGNTADTGFNVTVETGLSMTWDYEHSNFNVAPGAEATLTSQIQKDDEPTTIEGLDYTWYKRNGDDFEIISGQIGASYTIPTVTWRDDYKCVAVDAYWNKYDRSDYVGVENELSVRAANGETIFAVPYGGRVTLAVEASCLEGQDALQYKWSGWKMPNGGNVEFTESTDSSYVIDSVTENWGYKCDITDIYGNERDVEFSVTIIDPNDATSLTANSPETSVPEGIWAEGTLYSFTPQETGSYIFRVTGNSTGTSVYCALYNAYMNKITRAEKYGDATLAVNLTGGEEYFFKAGYTIRYGGEDPITVELISMSNASALTLGEAVAVNLTEGGQIVCFSFTPVQTGRYVFESFTDGDSYEDTYGILYDGNMQEIANDDSTGENGHFKLVHELSADTTYYFATRYYNCDGKGAFSVRLTTEE